MKNDFAEKFEDLRVWNDARHLANAVYDAHTSLKDFQFRSQIQSAAVSIMNNVAEGFERRSKREFAHFLDIAKASAGEVRSMLYLAEDRQYLEAKAASELRTKCERIARALSALASSLRAEKAPKRE